MCWDPANSPGTRRGAFGLRFLRRSIGDKFYSACILQEATPSAVLSVAAACVVGGRKYSKPVILDNTPACIN